MKRIKGDKVYNSIEVAELLDTSPDDVNYMARKGILPDYKERKFWRFDKRVVARWIKTRNNLCNIIVFSRT